MRGRIILGLVKAHLNFSLFNNPRLGYFWSSSAHSNFVYDTNVSKHTIPKYIDAYRLPAYNIYLTMDDGGCSSKQVALSKDLDIQHKEDVSTSSKDKDALNRQERDLADYRKRQRERWRKLHQTKKESSDDIPQKSSERQSIQEIQEICEKSKDSKHKRKRRHRISESGTPHTKKVTTDKNNGGKKSAHSGTERSKTKSPTQGREERRKINSGESAQDWIQEHVYNEGSKDNYRRRENRNKESRRINHDEKVRTERNDISRKSEHSGIRRCKTKSPTQGREERKKISSRRSTQDLIQEVAFNEGSKDIYRRRKNRKRENKQINPDETIASAQGRAMEKRSESPVVIDLDPVHISDSPDTSGNVDIIGEQDMDLVTSSEEDIVIISSTQPSSTRTSDSVVQTQAVSRSISGNEDDIMYMGTVINLPDSSPTISLAEKCELLSRPRTSESPSSASSCQDQFKCNQHQPVPSSTDLIDNSKSALNASGSFSSPFSRFMAAASFGNAMLPSPSLPTTNHQSTGMPPVHLPIGQPTAYFHQSTEAASMKKSPDNIDSSASPESRDANSPQNGTKLRNRSWERVAMGFPTSPDEVEFTVISYNVLAQNLLEDNSYLYENSNRRYLDWRYRSGNLIEEIQQYAPDILCLQEVNKDHYNGLFEPKLASMGYQGYYKKRTRDMRDGCATFFKTNKFQLDVVRPVEYLKSGTSVLDRDNVALILRLIPKNKTTNAKIVVANTHLLFNPRRGDVKLAQLALLLTEVDHLAHCDEVRNNPVAPTYHPTLVMGDFNSEPWSPLYQLLASGAINYEGQKMNTFSGQSEGRRGNYNFFSKSVLPRKLKVSDCCQNQDLVVQRVQNWVRSGEDFNSVECVWGPAHSKTSRIMPPEQLTRQETGTMRTFLPLRSVYTHNVYSAQRRRNEKEVTTHHGLSRCTVDYIFYAQGSRAINQTDNKKLQLVQRLQLLTDSEMKRCGELPNREVSSDHTLLAAVFQLKL